MSRPVSPETQILAIPGEFPLEGGDSLREVEVAYRTWGEPRSEATLICHALTGSADADDWWSGLFGSGRVFDPATDFVIAANVLGGCYGTTGPTSTIPGSSQPYGARFPEVSIRDMVRLQAALLVRLGVTRLRMVIGGSMGGMQATEFAATFPDLVGSAVSIGAGAAQSAWAMAFAAPQRAAIIGDPGFEGGRYQTSSGPTAGLATARMIAMVSYRGHENFESRFGRRLSDDGYEIEAYLAYQGDKLVDRFDANSYLRLLGAMDTHDLTRGRGETSATLEAIEVPVLAVGISTDVLFPAAEVRDLARSLPNGRYATLHAPQGHDAFLIETEPLNRMIMAFRADLNSGARHVSEFGLQSAKGAAWA